MEFASGFFGRDPETYNLEDDTGLDYLTDGSGRPGINIVANAIMFWLGQHGDSTIGAIAQAFKMPPAAVAEACEHHSYLFVLANDKPMAEWLVGQDGE